MIDLSKHIQEGARLELEALELSTDECSFLSAQNSAQAMQIDELKRDLAAAKEARQRAEALAESNARDSARYKLIRDTDWSDGRLTQILFAESVKDWDRKIDDLIAAIDAVFAGEPK